MMKYVARFTELACYTDDYVAIDLAKVRKFENLLKLSIRGKIVGLHLQDIDSMVGTTLVIERGIEDAQSIRDAGISGKRKEITLFLVWERDKGLLSHERPGYRASHGR